MEVSMNENSHHVNRAPPSAEEYKTLYGEIGRNSQICQHVFLANVAVTAGLIGYGLDSGIGVVFLAPFAIIIPSLFFLASQLESTTRIAAYILVFFEQTQGEFNWETRWLKLRENRLMPSKRKYTLSLSGLYGLLSVTCLLLAYQYWEHGTGSFLLTAVPIALLVMAGVRLIVRAFSIGLARSYVQSWIALGDLGGQDQLPPNKPLQPTSGASG